MATNTDSLGLISEDASEEETAQMEEMRQADVAEPSPSVGAEDGETPSVSPSASDARQGDMLPEEAPAEGEPPPIPYGVLREEREKRREIADELAAARTRMSQMETAFTKVMDRVPQPQQQQAQEPELPDFDLDPDAHNAAKLDRIEKRLAEQAQREQQGAQQRQKQTQANQFLSTYQKAVEDFSQERPDINDAYQHVISSFDKDLQLRGYSDPAERQKLLEFEEEQIVVRAFQAGVNPASRIMQLAESRGYTRAAEAPAEATESDKLDRIAKTEAASSSLATSGGDGGAPTVTLQRLSELDDAEFDKAWDQARKKGLLG